MWYGPATASKWDGVVGFLHVHGLGGARVALEAVGGCGSWWRCLLQTLPCCGAAAMGACDLGSVGCQPSLSGTREAGTLGVQKALPELFWHLKAGKAAGWTCFPVGDSGPVGWCSRVTV